MSPSTRSSFAPVTVTVCAVFQLAAVKVRVVALRLPSVASRPVRVTVTSAVGWELSLTVKLSVLPLSLVVSVALLRVRPALSLSSLVTFTEPVLPS